MVEFLISMSFCIFSAVRSGNVDTFQKVLKEYTKQFEADKTFTLIHRLHHNVIKTAIRRISLAYSRISLDDVSKKLCLSSPKDAEFIIAKVSCHQMLSEQCFNTDFSPGYP